MGLFGRKKKDNKDAELDKESQSSNAPSSQISNSLIESKTSATSKSGKDKKSKKKDQDHIYRDSVVTNAYESSLPGYM